MKKHLAFGFAALVFASAALLTSNASYGQTSDKDKDLEKDSREAVQEIKRSDAAMNNLFNDSYAYVVFPNVGKGAVGVGGAAGTGIVYEKGKAIGKAHMTQVSVGAQAGGQAYREVVFFEKKESLDRFKDNRYEVSTQASAIVVKSGAAASGKYAEGVMIFIQPKGGLMVEASVAGQKFVYNAF